MACTCNKDMLVKIEDKVKESLINKDIEDGSFSAEWQNENFNLSSQKTEIMLGVSYEYRALKKDGEPHKNKTKKSISIRMEYCPFCGTKYDEDEAAAA